MAIWPTLGGETKCNHTVNKYQDGMKKKKKDFGDRDCSWKWINIQMMLVKLWDSVP